MRPGLSLSYSGRRTSWPHSVRREFPCRGPTPACARAMTAALSRSCSGRRRGWLVLHRHRAHEPREFSSDGSARDCRLLPTRRECTEPSAQPRLRLPGDLADLWGNTIELLQLLRADAGREPIGPGALDEQLANARIFIPASLTHSPRRGISWLPRDMTTSSGTSERNRSALGGPLCGAEQPSSPTPGDR